MLKSLRMFLLVSVMFPMPIHANAHQPPAQTSSVIPQQPEIKPVPQEPQKHVSADVHVISTPDKDGYDKAAVWINLTLAIVGFLGVVIAIVTLVKIHQQTTIAARTLVLTQRPRIEVRTFYFHEARGVGGVYRVGNNIEEASFAGGQFYMVNVGGTRATIKEIVCKVFITNAALPAKRPYEGEIGSREEKVLEPGQSSPYIFGLHNGTFIGAGTANRLLAGLEKFYVLGWIGYVDDLKIYRITHFCRQYLVNGQRFFPVDDVEYENVS